MDYSKNEPVEGRGSELYSLPLISQTVCLSHALRPDFNVLYGGLEMIHSPSISEGSREGEVYTGVCLTVTPYSLERVGLWVAEWST